VSESPLVEAHGLTKAYGELIAVDSIDLEVSPGEVFGLLGPNGAGKTTTVLMLLGLSEPTAGTVRVCGHDPARDPLAVKRQVGYMPDTVGFYEAMTGRENLRYTAWLNELDSDETESRIDLLLEQVGLGYAADRRVKEYSRGMRQRLGLADTLIKDPLVVILDEPMVGIDPEGVIEMQGLITRLAREQGRAVMLTSHMLHQVQQTCDRMAIFVGGKVIAEGTAAELASRLAEGQAAYEVVAPVSESELVETLNQISPDATCRLVGTDRWRVSVPVETAPDLLPALVAAGIGVRQMRDLGSDLDEIYHRYFSEAPEAVA
jgi:ABC-2 type transport system ATP-binding protein